VPTDRFEPSMPEIADRPPTTEADDEHGHDECGCEGETVRSRPADEEEAVGGSQA
jgi:hypothetical protein